MVSGCSGLLTQGEPELGAVPVIRGNEDLGQLRLPLDPYMDDLAFIDLTERAADVLAQRCMRRFGLEYPRYRPAKHPDRPEHLRRWGVADPAEVARNGYVPQEALDLEPEPETPSVSPDADAVAAGLVSEYHGLAVPDGGCFGEAADILAGEPALRIQSDAPLPRRLSNESYEHALNDSRVKEAFKGWRKCMQAAGFRYRMPTDASGDSAWNGPLNERPTQQELATAKADIACRLEINLVGIMAAVDAAYQQRALETNREAVERAGARLRAMEARAREVLGE